MIRRFGMFALVLVATLAGGTRCHSCYKVIAVMNGQAITETFTPPGARVAILSATPDDIVVHVTLVNHGPGIFRLLRWNLPEDGRLTSDLFEVSRDGKQVRYRGKMVKRSVTSESYLTLLPGKECDFRISLAQEYDVAPTGQYKAPYHAWNQTAPDVSAYKLIEVRSNELEVGK